MDKVNFYWTVVVSVMAALWAVITYIRDHRAQAIEQTNATVDRLIKIDEIMIGEPDLPKYFSMTAGESEDYFIDPARLSDQMFFKAKALAYMFLNMFDEILAIASQSSHRRWFMNPSQIIELEDWEEYIKVKLSHPLYRSILNREGKIFGESLRNYWKQHQGQVVQPAANSFVW